MQPMIGERRVPYPGGFCAIEGCNDHGLEGGSRKVFDGPGPQAQGELGGESGSVVGVPVIGPLSKGKPWFQRLRVLVLEGYEWYKLRAWVGHSSRYEEEDQVACGTGGAPSLGWVWHREWKPQRVTFNQ